MFDTFLTPTDVSRTLCLHKGHWQRIPGIFTASSVSGYGRPNRCKAGSSRIRSRKQEFRADQSLESQSAYFPNPPWLWKPMVFRSSRQSSAKIPFCVPYTVLDTVRTKEVLLPVHKELNISLNAMSPKVGFSRHLHMNHQGHLSIMLIPEPNPR